MTPGTSTFLLCVDQFVGLEEVHAKVLEKELRQGVEELSKEHKRLTERKWVDLGFGTGPKTNECPLKRDYFNG